MLSFCLCRIAHVLTGGTEGFSEFSFPSCPPSLSFFFYHFFCQLFLLLYWCPLHAEQLLHHFRRLDFILLLLPHFSLPSSSIFKLLVSVKVPYQVSNICYCSLYWAKCIYSTSSGPLQFLFFCARSHSDSTSKHGMNCLPRLLRASPSNQLWLDHHNNKFVPEYMTPLHIVWSPFTTFNLQGNTYREFILLLNKLDAKICFTISLFHASTWFEHHVLIVRRSKLYYTASGIITPIGVMIPEAV